MSRLALGQVAGVAVGDGASPEGVVAYAVDERDGESYLVPVGAQR